MFTGIVQGTATLSSIEDRDGMRTLELAFPEGFCEDLTLGASVSVDGVCLTVTQLLSPTAASFDVILQSLNVTTLGGFGAGAQVNVERAAKDGAEIGGHPLSGHIDFSTEIISVRTSDTNRVLRIAIPEAFRKYVFAKGYIAINGASLTVSEVNRQEGWCEVWLIPETRRMTTFEEKVAGTRVNIEIERSTQVVVDTVREAVQESLGRLQPVLEALLKEKGLSLDDFVQAPQLPAASAAGSDQPSHATPAKG
ncbi:riboflavin synthase subunit alpha [Pandoraea pnomenusa]|uniref:riboflavin synthase subunit alpha n=1 Tax=Pandoraea pnomenusa TaxID=93220 RepID=UPI00242E4860|nr:riboflavin synthase subunit alpha [Pandoraea pnomenusa]